MSSGYLNGDGKKEFVALFGIDPDCSGGSAMYHSALAVLKRGVNRKYHVQKAQSFPDAGNEGLPQYTDRIFVRSGQLMFAGKDFDFEKDALCCPSVPVEGQLFLRHGTWIAEVAKGENRGREKNREEKVPAPHYQSIK